MKRKGGSVLAADANNEMSDASGVDDMLSSARSGNEAVLGQILEMHRGYLTLLANVRFEDKLRSRLSPSDIVQETMMDAYRDFDQFKGATIAEFRGWVRRILIHNLGTALEKHVFTAKRDVRRQVSLRQRLSNSVCQSANGLETLLADPEASVVGNICQQERLTQLADAIATLPDDYRDVIVQRNLEGRPFNDIAKALGRTSSATRMLWLRSVSKLRKLLEDA